MSVLNPIFVLPEGQVPPTNFDAWFDNFDDGVSRKLQFLNMATTVAKIQSVVGRCEDHPKCSLCTEGSGAYPMVRMGWNLSGFFRSVEFRFQSCVDEEPAEVPATIYATTNDVLLAVVSSLDLKRVRFGDEDLHNDNNPEDSYSSGAIARSLPHLKVFEYKNVSCDELDVIQRIHALLTQCHDLENISICGTSDRNWVNPLPEDPELVRTSAQLLAEAFGRPQTRNSTLKIVRFTHTYFSDEEMARLITVLSSAQSIEYLSLEGNVCGTLAMGALQKWFQNDDCKIRHFNLSNAFPTRVPISPLPTMSLLDMDLSPLIANKSLKELKIDGTALSDAAVESICQVLVATNNNKNSSTLEKLSMQGRTLTSTGVELIGSALPYFGGLQSVDLSDITDLTEEALDALGEGLAANTSLRHFYFRGVGSNRPNHLQSLFFAFETNTTLKEISVPNHDLSESVDTVATLALMLTRNTASLEKINLSGCRLTDLGFACFGLQFPRMTSLKSLDLSWNEYSLGGISALLTGMKNNFTISELVTDRLNDRRYGKEYGLIRFFLGMNRNGRRLLGTNLPMSLWPLVLARVEGYADYFDFTGNDDMTPSVLYMFLRNEILLTRYSGTDPAGISASSGRKRKACGEITSQPEAP
jgi:Ran GTPase-activating protein (RanGAP) involved in mRNA processing and transport